MGSSGSLDEGAGYVGDVSVSSAYPGGSSAWLPQGGPPVAGSSSSAALSSAAPPNASSMSLPSRGVGGGPPYASYTPSSGAPISFLSAGGASASLGTPGGSQLGQLGPQAAALLAQYGYSVGGMSGGGSSILGGAGGGVGASFSYGGSTLPLGGSGVPSGAGGAPPGSFGAGAGMYPRLVTGGGSTTPGGGGLASFDASRYLSQLSVSSSQGGAPPLGPGGGKVV